MISTRAMLSPLFRLIAGTFELLRAAATVAMVDGESVDLWWCEDTFPSNGLEKLYCRIF